MSCATIRNGNTLFYDMEFSVELARLTLDPEMAVEKLTKLADVAGDEAGSKIRSLIRDEPIVPLSRNERYTRALTLVASIGKAAGKMLYDVEFDGDHEPYYLTFWQGMKNGLKPEEVVGSGREKMFYECGWESVNIVGGSVFREHRASNAELRDMLKKTAAAFVEGVETCLV